MNGKLSVFNYDCCKDPCLKLDLYNTKNMYDIKFTENASYLDRDSGKTGNTYVYPC